MADLGTLSKTTKGKTSITPSTTQSTTVVAKTSSTRGIHIVIHQSGSGQGLVLLFDHPSLAQGSHLGYFPASAQAGQIFSFDNVLAQNGVTALVPPNGPTFDVFA
jgi:hypothetical protein